MKEWFLQQKKQENTKNNTFFTMDLSTFGENNVKLVLKALLSGDFEKGLKYDHMVANLVKSFDIEYLYRRYGEVTGAIVKQKNTRNFGNHSKNRYNNNRNQR